jgi:hypothetical protein
VRKISEETFCLICVSSNNVDLSGIDPSLEVHVKLFRSHDVDHQHDDKAQGLEVGVEVGFKGEKNQPTPELINSETKSK